MLRRLDKDGCVRRRRRGTSWSCAVPITPEPLSTRHKEYHICPNPGGIPRLRKESRPARRFPCHGASQRQGEQPTATWKRRRNRASRRAARRGGAHDHLAMWRAVRGAAMQCQARHPPRDKMIEAAALHPFHTGLRRNRHVRASRCAVRRGGGDNDRAMLHAVCGAAMQCQARNPLMRDRMDHCRIAALRKSPVSTCVPHDKYKCMMYFMMAVVLTKSISSRQRFRRVTAVVSL